MVSHEGFELRDLFVSKYIANAIIPIPNVEGVIIYFVLGIAAIVIFSIVFSFFIF